MHYSCTGGGKRGGGRREQQSRERRRQGKDFISPHTDAVKVSAKPVIKCIMCRVLVSHVLRERKANAGLRGWTASGHSPLRPLGLKVKACCLVTRAKSLLTFQDGFWDPSPSPHLWIIRKAHQGPSAGAVSVSLASQGGKKEERSGRNILTKACGSLSCSQVVFGDVSGQLWCALSVLLHTFSSYYYILWNFLWAFLSGFFLSSAPEITGRAVQLVYLWERWRCSIHSLCRTWFVLMLLITKVITFSCTFRQIYLISQSHDSKSVY